jgi:acyl carrier protein
MSNRRELLSSRLNVVFQEVFEDEQIMIFDEMTAKDVPGWDSLMHVVLVVAVEKEFGLRLNASEIGKLENVGAMLNLLVERATK